MPFLWLMLPELLPDGVVVLQYAFNLFSHNASVLSNGYNEEEMKMVKETRKIWVSCNWIFLNCLLGFFIFILHYVILTYIFLTLLQNDKDVKVTATCIRVPVMRAHAESVNLQFENPLDEVLHAVMLCLYAFAKLLVVFFRGTISE